MNIDIIIPTFNRGYCLKRAIESVLIQTYQNFHLYIIDDASTDETESLLDIYKNDSRVSYIKMEQNLGVSAARNLGIKNSNAKWIAFLDSDDEWLPYKIEKQIEYINQNPDIPLIHGEEIWYRNQKRVNPKNIHKKSGGDLFIRSLKLCLISPSSVLIKRDLITDLGGFDERFVVCEDYDLWLKITWKYKIGFIDIPILNKYGGHEDQLSAKYFAMDYYRVKAIHNLLSENELALNQKTEALKELLEKCRILILGYKKHNNTKDLAEIISIEAWGRRLSFHGEEPSSKV